MQEVFEKIIDLLQKEYYLDKTELRKVSFNNGISDAIKIVKQAFAEYNDGWIPCSETPKTSDYILLSFSNFSVPMVGRYEENENGGAYYIGDEDKSCVSQDIFVNAWQPLPEPYQPNGE